jgi:hypothetical protein
MRRVPILPAVLVVVVVLVAGCTGPTADQTTSSAAGITVTTVVQATTTTTAPTTTTTMVATTTTTGPTIATTTDYATEFKAQHQSSESFTNKDWDVVRKDADGHKGAAVDIVGMIANIAVLDEVPSLPQRAGWTYGKVVINRRPDNGDRGYELLCITKLKIDPDFIGNEVLVHVKGLVLGAPLDHWDAVVYVTSVEEAAAAEYAAMYRAEYPSSESFTNKDWDVVHEDADNHQGAAVDIVGTVVTDFFGPDEEPGQVPAGWTIWEVDINGGPDNDGYKVMCFTRLKIDPALIKDGTIVGVKGLVLGAPQGNWDAIVYVTAVEKSSAAAIPKSIAG